MLNVHFWYYYVPLCACVRKLSFGHFDSIFFTRISPASRSIFFIQPSQLPFINFAGRKTEQRERCSTHHRSTLPNHPPPAIPPPPYPSPTYPLPRYDPHCTVPLHISAHRLRNIYLALHQTFSPCIHLVITVLFLWPIPFIPNRSYNSLKEVTRPTEDLYNHRTPRRPTLQSLGDYHNLIVGGVGEG